MSKELLYQLDIVANTLSGATRRLIQAVLREVRTGEWIPAGKQLPHINTAVHIFNKNMEKPEVGVLLQANDGTKHWGLLTKDKPFNMYPDETYWQYVSPKLPPTK